MQQTEEQHMTDAIIRVCVLCILILLMVASGASFVLALDRIGGQPLGSAPATLFPETTMRSGVLVTSDGRELWSRDPAERRAMASTTKIMTALVAMENAGPEETVTVTSRHMSVGGSNANLRPGEQLTVSDAIEAILLVSANEVAIALAEHVSGSQSGFVDKMNSKAQQLGMLDTRFENAHGLDTPGHYSSARDLSLLARYAMTVDEFRAVAVMDSFDPDGAGERESAPNTNLLVGEFEGATGVKTGWTSRAGHCLIASSKRGDVELFAVVLGSPDENARFDDAAKLLQWGHENFVVRRLVGKGSTFGQVPVSQYLDRSTSAVAATTLEVPVFSADGEVTFDIILYPEISAPFATDTRLGTLTVTQGERLLGRIPLVATEDVPAPGFFESAWIALQRLVDSVFGRERTITVE